MKNNATRIRNRRTFAEHFQATFGRIDVRKLRRRGLLVLGVGAVLVTGAASADWRVYDQRVQEVLEDIRDNYIGKDDGTVTTHLKNVNDRLAITGDEYQAGDGGADNPTLVQPKENDDKLTDKAKPTQAAGVALAERCPGGTTTTGILAEQHKICQEMYKTEIAKYRFSLEMYDLAQKRNEKLQAIVAERNALDETDFGKMEENTNKLVALTAQMDNDRDRYTTYMNAYDARVMHLQKSSDLLSKQAITGNSGGGGGIVPGAIGAGVLALALRTAAQTGERDCTARMQQAGVC